MDEKEINEKLDKYFSMTETALEMVEIADEKNGSEFLSMAKNYLDDAKHFREKGDLLTSLAAASYAHAWLDAGAKAGFFRVDNSENLFTTD